ncbi:MAG: hypothetical protein WD770_05825 [Actinomycetota bacterium]
MQRWSARGRFFAGLTLVVVIAASDRLGGLGRTAPMARQTGRPLVLTTVGQDLSATAPNLRRLRWDEGPRRLRSLPDAGVPAGGGVAPPAVALRFRIRPARPAGGLAGLRTSSPRAPPGAHRPQVS